MNKPRKYFSALCCLALAPIFLLSGKEGQCSAMLPRLRDGSYSGTANVNIKGIILSPPPCTINNNTPIDVDFGNNLATTKIDGTNYLKQIDYSVSCTGATSNEVKLSIQGTVADFDDAALQTNMADLGVELRHEGEKLKIGDWINFTYPALPVLLAVPVKRADSTLDAGDFSAGATMVVDWQ